MIKMKKFSGLLVILLYCGSSQLWAEEAKKIYLQGVFGYGWGGDDLPTGMVIAKTKEEIFLNAGGGWNYGGALGYKINPSLSAELGVGYQISLLSTWGLFDWFNPAENATGSFERIPITATGIYNFFIKKTPADESLYFYLGSGVGIYASPKVYIAGWNLPGRMEINYNYNSGKGVHGLVGIKVEAKRFFVLWELKYTSVKYDFKEGRFTYTYYGIDEKVTPETVGTKYKKIDGSSIDFIMGIGILF